MPWQWVITDLQISPGSGYYLSWQWLLPCLQIEGRETMGDITITRNSPAAEDILRDVWELYYGIIVRHEDNRIAASGLPVYDGAQAMVKGLMAVVYPDYDPDLVLDVAIDIGELPTRDALDYRLQF